jgi:hypothetical protein
MAEVVNLRTARKQRRRAEGRDRGTEAAARSGESAAGRRLRLAEEARAARRHEGHRLNRDESGDG